LPNWPTPYDGFHNMVFTEESTVGAFLLRARREGLRDFGACMSPHSAWLILQGIETLSLRMERHMRNTEKVVEFLASQPFVARGAPDAGVTPQPCAGAKTVAARRGFGVQFDLKGSRAQGKAFVEALKVFSHLANVGDCAQPGDSPGDDHPLPHDG
jgi:O-acetylhomoserine (thiol)-lyase